MGREEWEKAQKERKEREALVALNFPRYPVDNDGFAVAHDAHEPEKYIPLLQSHGVVVIRALSRDQCEKMVTAMFADMNMQQNSSAATHRLDPTKPETWETVNWPAASLLESGDKGSKFLVLTPTLCQIAFENRVSNAVYTAFKHIYGSEDLLCSLDVWGIARGTSKLQQSSPVSWTAAGSETEESATTAADSSDPSTPAGHDHDEPEEEWKSERPEWRWELPLHWHVNPWKHHITHADRQPTYMSLVALVDCARDVGSHLTVPGSTAYLAQWAQDNAHLAPNGSVKNTIYVPSKDVLKSYAQALPLRAGDLVIWDRRQAHGSFANHGPDPRLFQFIRYFPRGEEVMREDALYPDRLYAKYNQTLQPGSVSAALSGPAPTGKEHARLWALLRSLLGDVGERERAALENARTLQELLAIRYSHVFNLHGGRGWRVFNIPKTCAVRDPPPAPLAPQPPAGFVVVRKQAQAAGAGSAFAVSQANALEGSSGMATDTVEIEEGVSSGWRTSDSEHEVMFVLSGRLDVVVGEQEFQVGAGEVVMAAPGVRRRHTALERSRLLIVKSRGASLQSESVQESGQAES